MMYKLCFYVPVDAAEKVKQAIFAAGAGRMGNYDQCCWQVQGVGQFRPLAGASPAVGESFELNCVNELKVELVCESSAIKAVMEALIATHPYETPAYHAWPVQTLEDFI